MIQQENMTQNQINIIETIQRYRGYEDGLRKVHMEDTQQRGVFRASVHIWIFLTRYEVSVNPRGIDVKKKNSAGQIIGMLLSIAACIFAVGNILALWNHRGQYGNMAKFMVAEGIVRVAIIIAALLISLLYWILFCRIPDKMLIQYLQNICAGQSMVNSFEQMVQRQKIVIHQLIPKGVKVALVLAGLFFGAVIGYIRSNPTISSMIQIKSVDPVGKSLEIAWADTYVDDGITQKDIDSDTVQWICATYAIQVVAEQVDTGDTSSETATQYGLIGMMEPSAAAKQHCADFLEQAWGITDRKSAIETINHVLEHGSREKYPGIVEELKNADWIADDLFADEVMGHYEEDVSLRYWGAYQAWQNYEKQGIDAWDYCRIIRVSGLCYLAGYINLTESLDQSLAIAKYLQTEFDDWESLGCDYAYGYEFWQAKEQALPYGKVYLDIVHMLYTEGLIQEGPFALDFHTTLEKTW